jgi:large subunit ribosomal protein L23
MDIHSVIQHPISNEKSIRLMESENKLVFVVAMKATKPDIKKAAEELFSAKVTKVATHINRDAKKVAYITFDSSKPAIDIATSLGMI